MCERDLSSRRPLRVVLALLLPWIFLTVSACDAGSGMDTDDPKSPEPAPGHLFQTGQPAYAATRVSQLGRTYFREEVAVHFQNRTSSSLYYTRCAHIQLVPSFERRVQSSWVSAILTKIPAIGPCTWQELLPGDSLSFGVSPPPITDDEFQEQSGLPPDSIAGDYRLTFRVFGDSLHNAHGPEPAKLVDIELRRTNTFRLTVENQAEASSGGVVWRPGDEPSGLARPASPGKTGRRHVVTHAADSLETSHPGNTRTDGCT